VGLRWDDEQGCKDGDKSVLTDWRVSGVTMVKRRQWASVGPWGWGKRRIRGRRVKNEKKIRIISRVLVTLLDSNSAVRYNLTDLIRHLTMTNPPENVPSSLFHIPLLRRLHSILLSLCTHH
jgi:hypothetical protein